MVVSAEAFPDDRLAVIHAHAPAALDSLREAYDEALLAADPQLLALARGLIREMVGSSSDSARAFADWRTGSFDSVEQACLAFTEQFVFSVADIDDELVLGLLRNLSNDEVYGLVNAIYVLDATERLAATVDALFGEVHDE